MLLVALLLSALQTACMAPAQFNVDGPAYEVSVAYIGSRPAVAWYGGRLHRAALCMRSVSNRGTGLPPGASPHQRGLPSGQVRPERGSR